LPGERSLSSSAKDRSEELEINERGEKEMKKNALVIVYSYHHQNTEKVAKKIAGVLDAKILKPMDIDPEEISDFDLIGFGSGIYGEDLHKRIHECVDSLPDLTGKKAFIFSTNGAPAKIADQNIQDDFQQKNHLKIRNKLESKGLEVVGDYSCPGFNTNLFMKFFGGLNKGRPNADDLKKAEDFALELMGEI